MAEIRILQVFGKLDRNGAETMLMNIYRHIDRDKVQFDFVVHSKEIGDYEQEIRMLGGQIYCCPRYTGKNHFFYINWWKNFFQTHNYPVLHSHIRSTASLYIPYFHRYCGGIAIAHSHSITSGKGISGAVKNLLQLPLRYEADYLFACSEDAAQWLFGKRAASGKKCRIIRNAIDSVRYAYQPLIRKKYRKEFGIENHLVIGHVGRFCNEKNHSFLLEAFEKLHQVQPNSILMLVGRGEHENEIRKAVEAKGLETQVLFLGNRDDVPELMQAMDILAFPSVAEGLGMVVIEAQAAGLPVVCSEIIPKEATLIENLVHREPLHLGTEHFAKTILHILLENTKRKDVQKILIDNGWDIRENAKWMEKFYIQASNEEN